MKPILTAHRRTAGRCAPKMHRIVHRAELQEMILAMGLALVIVGAAFETGFRTWRTCTDYSHRATDCTEVEILRRNWRAFVRTLDTSPELRGPTTLVAGAHRAHITDNRIVLESRARTRALHVPDNMTAAFDVEDGGNGTCLLVLNIRTENRVHDSNRTRRSRIVACAPSRVVHSAQGGTP